MKKKWIPFVPHAAFVRLKSTLTAEDIDLLKSLPKPVHFSPEMLAYVDGQNVSLNLNRLRDAHAARLDRVGKLVATQLGLSFLSWLSAAEHPPSAP